MGRNGIIGERGVVVGNVMGPLRWWDVSGGEAFLQLGCPGAAVLG